MVAAAAAAEEAANVEAAAAEEAANVEAAKVAAAKAEAEAEIEGDKVSAKALFDFEAQEESDLSFAKGDVLLLPAGSFDPPACHTPGWRARWVLAQNADGGAGNVPLNYLEPL